MTVIAGISIDSGEFDLGQVLAGAGATTRIELAQFVPTNTSSIPYFWVEPGASHDQEAFEATVKGDPRVKLLTNLDGGIDRTLYYIEWATPIEGFIKAIDDTDIMIERAVGSTEKWSFRLRAHDSEALAVFQRACFEEDIPIDIYQVSHNPTGQMDSLARLTDKQREALLLAINHGHFSVPRESSQSDLAEELGISRQAFSRRLRRALSALLEEVVVVDK